MIVDNAEEPAVLVQYLLGGGGHVIITSRNPGWQELATPVEVDVFDRDESITLLRRRAPQLTDNEARRIAQALGDLPLALAQAAAYLADTTTGVQDYLALLTERTTELLNSGLLCHLPDVAGSQRPGRSGPAGRAISSCAAAAHPGRLPGTGADSLTLLTTHPTQLPESLTTAAADPLAFTALTRLLRQHGLARLEPTTLASIGRSSAWW